MELTRKVENNKLSFFSEKEEIFSIAEDMQGKDILLTLSGNMRSETLYGFQDELEALLSVSTDGIIILDMKNVKYISSAHMSAILEMQVMSEQQGKGGLKLLHLPEAIYKEMKEIGLAELLWIE